MSTNENQTLEFCRSILGDGIRFAFTLPDGRHHACADDTELIAKATELDAAPGIKAVYFACATYAEPYITGPDGKRRYRVKENVGRVKAIWLDIDCGADKAAKGQGYSTKNEAFQALKDFCKAAGLPMPTWIVDSGHGMHLYWSFGRAVDRATWEGATGRLKQVCQRLGFLADPSRTTDVASVLRLPGSVNRKDPANPRLVKVKYQGKPVSLEAFDAAVCAALARMDEEKPHEVQEPPEGIGAPPAWAKASGGTGNIVEAAPQRRQHTIEEAEEVLAFIDPGCDRATWFKVLAALVHEFGESARALAHRWSGGQLWRGGAA